MVCPSPSFAILEYPSIICLISVEDCNEIVEWVSLEPINANWFPFGKTNENKIIGIVVDFIEKIVDIDPNKILNLPDVSVGMDSKYIKGMVQTDDNEMVTLVNIDTLLSINDL